MMRKYFLILLAFCLMLSFAGCSASSSTENKEEGIHFELLPENADLSLAPGVVVEPKKAPYNLGGWTADNIVFWEVELPEDGQYSFKITYSRPTQYPMAEGILRVDTADGVTHDMHFQAPPTGKNKKKDDWSVYVTKDSIGDNLVAGPAFIWVIPNYEPGDGMPEHFINLRSIAVTCTPDSSNSSEDEPNEQTPASKIEQAESENEKVALENTYKIIIDGENMTGKMNLVIQDYELYAEATSYFDALTHSGNPILYSEYDKETGVVGVYSWATDVMILRFHMGTNIGYRLIDAMNDQWEEKRLDADIYADSQDNALIPVKTVTEYLISLGQLEATVEE
ncbi:hypothetical protein ACS3UN_11990 [Oscillospiraceae bacterium LTW-04]|nr:hypothetical protein RBH76_13730 [Oscillospiraceae bacterium MB24-C1]